MGLSDFYKLVVTVLNEKHERMPSKIIQYRDYKNFDYAVLNNIRKQAENLNFIELDFAIIRKIFMKILHKFSPSKKEYIRANHSKFVTTELGKAIMWISNLKNQLKIRKNRNITVLEIMSY